MLGKGLKHVFIQPSDTPRLEAIWLLFVLLNHVFSQPLSQVSAVLLQDNNGTTFFTVCHLYGSILKVTMVMFPHQPCQLASRFFFTGPWKLEDPTFDPKMSCQVHPPLPGGWSVITRIYLRGTCLVNQIILQPKNEFTFYGLFKDE